MIENKKKKKKKEKRRKLAKRQTWIGSLIVVLHYAVIDAAQFDSLISSLLLFTRDTLTNWTIWTNQYSRIHF